MRRAFPKPFVLEYPTADTMPRFDGRHDDIVDILVEFASGPDFIRYPEANKPKLQRTKILALKSMWVALRAAHPALTWSQKDGQVIFEKIADRCSEIWDTPVSVSERHAYAERMCKRFRNMSLHIRHTQQKHPGTAWLRQLWGESCKSEARNSGGDADAKSPEDDDCAGDDGTDDDEAGPTPEVPASDRRPPLHRHSEKKAVPKSEHLYGYDHEQKQAWRCGAKPPFTKEFASKMRAGATNDSPAEALFSTGDWQPIAAVSSGELALSTAFVLGSRGPLWEGKTPKGKALRIARRKDRDPLGLIVLLERHNDKWRMVLMTQISKFGKTETAINAAYDMVRLLAEDYAQGLFTWADRYEERDRRLGALGLSGAGSADASTGDTKAPSEHECGDAQTPFSGATMWHPKKRLGMQKHAWTGHAEEAGDPPAGEEAQDARAGARRRGGRLRDRWGPRRRLGSAAGAWRLV